MVIRETQSESDLRSAFSILKELRKDLNWDDFLSLYDKAKDADGYGLWLAFETEKPVGVMGMRILYDYVHGKHLYIDDLVTTEAARSKGIGSKMLKFAEGYCAETNCNLLRLSTGTENEGGKKFYAREGWTLRSVTFKKKL
ncbi:MAG: GNAT family N-acetyltransferase [Bdellovibrionales bacterium]|nr:GNAT family N-acetyltransferase [Bdellovibrionales bacterium]